MPRHRAAARLLVFGSCAAAASADAIDLYVRERYRTSGDEPCGFCEERGGCHLDTLNFYPQGGCRGRGAGKSSVYDEVADGTLCRQDFPDTTCEVGPAFDASSPADECGQRWTLGECDADSSLRATRLGEWCIASAAPIGKFEVPLVTVKVFGSAEDCGSSDYQTRWQPSDGELCVPGAVEDEGGALMAASLVSFCDGDVLRAERYAAPGCSGTAEPLRSNGTSDECPPAATGEDSYVINDCKSPTYHCKKLDLESILVATPPSATSSTAAAVASTAAASAGEAENSQTVTSSTAAAVAPSNASPAGEAAATADPLTSPPSKSPIEQAVPEPDPDSLSGAWALGVALQTAIAALCSIIFV